ncbi:MAG: hypothetical protein ABI199_05120 [Bacteroidia bacterium]
MKKILTLVVALCIIYTSKADNSNNGNKFTLGVSAGAALPMGTGNYGMYAQTGFHFDVTASYLFSGNIGGMVYIGENMNSFDNATFMSENRLANYDETFTSKGYNVGQYLAGPFLSLPASNKLKVNIRVLVGLVTANMPTETINGYFDTETVSGNGGIGFGYQLGAGLKYNLSDKIGLTFNVAYTGASICYAGYSDAQIGTYQSGTSFNYTKTYTTKSTMPIGLVTSTLGLAFNL